MIIVVQETEQDLTTLDIPKEKKAIHVRDRGGLQA
jgi:hypothetical protein